MPSGLPAKAPKHRWAAVKGAVEEESITNSRLSPVASSSPSAQPMPTIVIAGASASSGAPSEGPSASRAPSAKQGDADKKHEAETHRVLKTVTLLELINRSASFFDLRPNSLKKKLDGADVVILGALAGLKKGEEVLDCQESDTQAQLGSAVQAIIKNKNLASAEDLLKIADASELFVDKTYRENLRKFIAEQQRADDAVFQLDYNKECAALQERLKKHIDASKKYDHLIDGTYRLGGKRNLTDEEIAFLQGNKSKLTREQQEALAKKQNDRVRAGLSDNEEEHPEFVDPKTIIKVPASQLSSLKPGAKSLKLAAAKK